MKNINYLSLTAQSIYVVITGLQLIFIPSVLLGMFGFETPTEVWIKVLGVLVLGLAILYQSINKAGSKEVVLSTIWFRSFVAAGFLFLTISGQVKLTIMFFASIDIATAIWTWFELKQKNI